MKRSNRFAARRLAWSTRLLTGCAVALALWILLGVDGLTELARLRRALDQQAAVVYSRAAANQAIREHLEGLRNDDRVLEETIRTRLGFVHDDEITYLFSPR
jgi:cell division protein FtsB